MKPRVTEKGETRYMRGKAFGKSIERTLIPRLRNRRWRGSSGAIKTRRRAFEGLKSVIMGAAGTITKMIYVSEALTTRTTAVKPRVRSMTHLVLRRAADGCVKSMSRALD